MNNNSIDKLDQKKILAEIGNLISSHCVCGHSVHEHYPLHNWMTGCKNSECDCLEFEGV
jgi:hypothetical protein